MTSFESLTAFVALAVTGAALGAGALALVVTGRPTTALAVLLDLLLAAGLLRLTGDPSWQVIATAAVIVLLRRLIGAGLRVGGRTWSSGPPSATGTPPSVVVRRLLRPAWRL